ncbi:MAG: cyclic nucleotide-binding domain-containing protein [Planctomycetes bacterium]|nr:cyclic nucleotide-binding domain-containing protein [Planctomycetota bacterium]
MALARHLSIRPGEGRVVLAIGANSALYWASTIILFAAADGLFLSSYPAASLPYAILGGALLGLAGSFVYETLQRRLTTRALSRAVTIALALSVLALRAIFYYLPGLGTILLVLLAPPASVLLGVDSVGLAVRRLDARASRRLLPMIGAMGSSGALSGGLLTGVLAPLAGTLEMLWISALLMLLLLFTHGGEMREAPSSMAAKPASWRAVLGHRFAFLLIGIAFVSYVLTTLTRFQLGACLKETWPPDRIAAFLGYLFAALHAAAVVYHLALARFVIRGLGVGAALAVYPATVAMASLVAILVPGLAAVAILYLLERLLRPNLLRPITAVAAQPLPDAIRSRASLVVRGAVEPPAVSIACLALLAGSAFVTWQIVSTLLAAGSVAVLAASLAARRGYLLEVVAALRARRLHAPEGAPEESVLPAEARRLAHLEIESGTQEQAALALALLEGQTAAETVRSVERAWSKWTPALKAEAIRVLSGDPVPETIRFLESLDPDEPVEVLAARLRSPAHDLTSAERDGLLANGPPRLAAEVLIRLAAEGGADALVRDRVSRWLGSDESELRRLAATVIGHSRDESLWRELPRLEADHPVETIASAARTLSPRFAELCARGLAREETFHEARSALLAMGGEARSALVSAAREPGLSPAAISVLGETPDPSCREILLGLLADPDGELRLRAARSLLVRGRAGARHDGAPIRDAGEEGKVRAALEGELEECRRVRAISGAALGPVREEAATRFERALERVFLLLSLLHPGRPLRKVHLALASGEPEQRSFALEALDESLQSPWRVRVLALLEGREPDPDDVPPEPWVERLENALARRGDDPLLDRAILMKSGSLFRRFSLLDLEPLATEALEMGDGAPWPPPAGVWIVLDPAGEPVELERTIRLAATPVSRVPGSLALPLDKVYDRTRLAPRSVSAWLSALAGRGAAGPSHVPDVSRSAPSIGSRGPRENPDRGAELSLWHRLFFLRRVFLFSALSGASLRLLAGIARPLSAAKGEVLVREGRPGHHFYVLCSGAAEVKAGGRTLALLQTADAFGEMALLSGAPRNATVRTLSSCDLLSIDRIDFLDLLETHPSLVRPLSEMIAQRELDRGS